MGPSLAAVWSLYESEECCTRTVLSPGEGLILPGPLPVEGIGLLVCEEIPVNVLVMLFSSVVLFNLAEQDGSVDGVYLKGKTSIANKSILWLAPSMGATLQIKREC